MTDPIPTVETLRSTDPFLAGVSPAYWAHIPMTISDILNLNLRNGIEFQHETPVSKCRLVACIVSLAPTSDTSLGCVLDDGTGVIDCNVWLNQADNFMNDIYSLPTLMETDTKTSDVPQLGDMVTVYGTIHALGESKQGTLIREIKASLVEPLDISTASGLSLDAEAEHWIESGKSTENPMDYLKLLGPHIATQVRERRDFPAPDDTLGAWRIFGVSCRCKLPYMDDLLYCHCQAKSEPLDPQYLFRDAVLQDLLRKQKVQGEPLTFVYGDFKKDPSLSKLCVQQKPPDCKNEIIFTSQLWKRTFAALRKDGILSLIDSHRDCYLFITKEKVLEPHVKRNNGASIDGVSYLGPVHRERLFYIHRCMKRNTSSSKA